MSPIASFPQALLQRWHRWLFRRRMEAFIRAIREFGWTTDEATSAFRRFTAALQLARRKDARGRPHYFTDLVWPYLPEEVRSASAHAKRIPDGWQPIGRSNWGVHEKEHASDTEDSGDPDWWIVRANPLGGDETDQP